MSPIVLCNLEVLAIAAIYLAWRALRATPPARSARHERVAQLLWAAAQKVN